jgi:hypothetical protein
MTEMEKEIVKELDNDQPEWCDDSDWSALIHASLDRWRRYPEEAPRQCWFCPSCLGLVGLIECVIPGRRGHPDGWEEDQTYFVCSECERSLLCD